MTIAKWPESPYHAHTYRDRGKVMADAPRLFGTRAVVTGAADGIGEAIARIFVKQGASVFAVDGRDTNVDRQFGSLRGVTPHVANIRDEESARAVLDAAEDALDGLDVVVINTLLQTKTPIADSDTAELDSFLDQRIRVYSAVARGALPLLERSPAGRIVSVGCIRSAFATAGEEADRRAEQALGELTQTLAAEAGPDGITVNYIQPGAIMTPDSRRIFSENKDLRDHCIRRSAARRLGEPVDIAKVALFLASDDAVFVSGTGIRVNGGSAAV